MLGKEGSEGVGQVWLGREEKGCGPVLGTHSPTESYAAARMHRRSVAPMLLA